MGGIGSGPRPGQIRVQDQDLIQDLIRVGTYKAAVYNLEGAYSMFTAMRRFGSWNRALAVAGIARPVPVPRVRYRAPRLKVLCEKCKKRNCLPHLTGRMTCADCRPRVHSRGKHDRRTST